VLVFTSSLASIFNLSIISCCTSAVAVAVNATIAKSCGRRNLIFKVNPTYQRQKFVVDYVTEHDEEAGIIYCSTRKQVEELQEVLESHKVKCTIYHAGLTNNSKSPGIL
jgi:ATP-dependent DNA helicase RecQ